jgi:hypothetical protein
MIITRDGRNIDLAGPVSAEVYAELEATRSPQTRPAWTCGTCHGGVYLRHGNTRTDVLYGAHHQDQDCQALLAARLSALLSDEQKRQRRERDRRRRAANPEKYREQARRRWAANPEPGRERWRRNYAANPEKNRDRSRRWSAANPEKRHEQARLRYAADPEGARRRRRASQAASQANTIATAQRQGYVWTGPELEVAARTDLTVEQAALMLGRTYNAVASARARIRTDPRYDRLAGLHKGLLDDKRLSSTPPGRCIKR